MDDNGWEELIKDTLYMESHCKDYLPNGMKTLNWAFHAGLTGDPIMAYELNRKKANVIDKLCVRSPSGQLHCPF